MTKIINPFDDIYWMKKAFIQAEKAYEKKEVPVGAVVVCEDKIIGQGYNQVEILCDATAHAEMVALTAAQSYLKNWRLDKATLYVTKEPCIMCAGAMINSRLGKLVYSVFDEYEGACGSKYDLVREHRRWFIDVKGGIMEDKGKALLQEFFQKIRSKQDD